jgi:GNAT superfamily N-acetyltransferase
VVPVEQVRTAGEHDIDRLVELCAAFHDANRSVRGGAAVHPGDGGGQPPAATHAAVGAYVTGGGRTALVGLLDDWTAGAALCRVDAADGGRRGVLDVCFVEPGAREVGLGRLLLDHALAWFRDEGCTAVDGRAFPGDREAKQFFESAGFKARLLVMHLPLD